MTKNIEQMEAKRRELDREIRAAKRAEAKAEKAALLSARQTLGVRLAKAVGADTIEAVELLQAALESGQVRRHLCREIGTESSDTSEHSGDLGGGERHDVA